MADFMGLMKQAAQLQSKMQALQAELDTIEVEGTAGGGMVSVRLTAKGDLKGIKVDDSLMKPSEKEILEDLLVAAHADARKVSCRCRVCVLLFLSFALSVCILFLLLGSWVGLPKYSSGNDSVEFWR